MNKLLWIAMLLSPDVEEPRIGCWIEEGEQMSQALLGVPGNLIVRREQSRSGCVLGEAGVPEEGTGLSRELPWTIFKLNAQWRIAVTKGTAYALYQRASGRWERFELPR